MEQGYFFIKEKRPEAEFRMFLIGWAKFLKAFPQKSPICAQPLRLWSSFGRCWDCGFWCRWAAFCVRLNPPLSIHPLNPVGLSFWRRSVRLHQTAAASGNPARANTRSIMTAYWLDEKNPWWNRRRVDPVQTFLNPGAPLRGFFLHVDRSADNRDHGKTAVRRRAERRQ